MSDTERKSIIELIEMVPPTVESVDLVVSEKLLEGVLPDTLHFNFYMGARGDDYATPPFRASQYNRGNQDPFCTEGFVGAYIKAIEVAMSTMSELFYTYGKQKARIIDETYFGELIFRQGVDAVLFSILSQEIGRDQLNELSEALANEDLKTSLVSGCERFSVALETGKMDDTPQIVRSTTVKYIHEDDHSSIIPFAISENL